MIFPGSWSLEAADLAPTSFTVYHTSLKETYRTLSQSGGEQPWQWQVPVLANFSDRKRVWRSAKVKPCVQLLSQGLHLHPFSLGLGLRLCDYNQIHERADRGGTTKASDSPCGNLEPS